MLRARGPVLLPALVPVLVLVLLASSACSGGSSTTTGGSAGPEERTGKVVPVDACALTGRPDMRRAVGGPVRVVGRELDPPTLPTETCLWGLEFGVPVVEVQVTPGPVAEDTFEAAFGPAAGDHPRPLQVGEAAYAREGLTSRTLQVFDHGVVLSIEARDAPGNRLPRGALSDVAGATLDRLPANPALADRSAPPPCRVGEHAVAAAMRTPVRMRTGHVGATPAVSGASGRPATCSWAGLPGNVVVTVRTDPVQITNFRANLSPRVYQRVPRVGAETWSQSDHAGDLLIFLDDAMVEVATLPGEGFSSPEVATTPGETRLAREIVHELG